MSNYLSDKELYSLARTLSSRFTREKYKSFLIEHEFIQGDILEEPFGRFSKILVKEEFIRETLFFLDDEKITELVDILQHEGKLPKDFADVPNSPAVEGKDETLNNKSSIETSNSLFVTNRKLRVFLCHASQDKPVVRDLYQRLRSEDWIDPWLDEEKLLPGQDWNLEIEKAVESADVVIVCVSSTSVSKEGYIQRELRFALDIALEKPEGAIFIIPLRLNDCELPRRIRSWQYVDLFPEDHRQTAYQKLLQSLQVRSKDANPGTSAREVRPSTPPDSSMNTVMDSASAGKTGSPILSVAEAESKTTALEVGGTISLIVYLLLTSFDLFASTGDAATYLVAASALGGGVILLFRRSFPRSSVYKYSLAVYLLGYGLNDNFFSDENQLLSVVVTASALVCSGLLAMTFRSPKKTANYSTVFLAVFLFFYGASAVLNSFTSAPPAIIGLVLSVITSILLFMDL